VLLTCSRRRVNEAIVVPCRILLSAVLCTAATASPQVVTSRTQGAVLVPPQNFTWPTARSDPGPPARHPLKPSPAGPATFALSTAAFCNATAAQLLDDRYSTPSATRRTMAGDKYQPLTLTPINFSLTEGTSIPAPPDSPPDTPRPPTPGKGPLSSHPTPKSAVFPHRENGESPPADDSAESSFHKTTTNDNASTMSPASPSSRRPSSVRKFLGFRPQSSHDSLRSEKLRPGSPATIASQPSLTRKKSNSWFGKRKSTFGIASVPEGRENTGLQSNGTAPKPAPLATPPKKKGPPPPALPELKSFGVSDDALSLGADDMFKNIK
jgi:hypothetical protein